MSVSDLAKLAAPILLALLLSLPAAAQDIDEEFENEFPEEPLTYVGLGPGMTATFIFMDLEELNKLARAFQVDEFGGPLTVYGGGVIFTPIFIPNIRIGLYAFGGYHRSSRPIQFEDDSIVYNRTLRFGIRFQGSAGVEYAMPISGRFTILPAVIAGWGSYALEFTQSTSPTVDFRDIWDAGRFRPGGAVGNQDAAVRMLNYHAFLYPTVHFEFAITGNLMVRGSAGYHLGILDDKWNNETETLYENVPSINANGPAAQIGLFFGLFQQ